MQPKGDAGPVLRATWVLLLAAGCSHGKTDASGGIVGPLPPAGGALCVTAEPVPTPLRRLTRLEYNNTVRDLLAVNLAPADGFPPDEIAGGFSNNASVLTISPLLAEKYMDAAEALAAEAIKNLPALVPCDPTQAGEDACARQFVQRFGRRAFRRPLAPAEIDRLMRAYAAGRADGAFASGVEAVIQTALQSPSFLYRVEFGGAARPGDKLVPLTQHELATRLSYFLWGSMPDDALAAAADGGQLGTVEQIATQARAMLEDNRARRAVGEFYRQWLGLGALDTLTKDSAVHPEFTNELRGAMAAETQAFVEHVLWSSDRRLATMLSLPVGFVTAPLARLYGVPEPAGTTLQMVALEPSQRVGVLTQAGVLAVHALPNQSSPVARGKFVRERLLCQDMPPPPPDLMVTPPEVDPTRPTRERFAQHTQSAACSICHELMDPIGFGFESYDAIGRFRTTDGGRAVDDSGWIAKSTDLDGPFRGPRELADKLAGSAQVRDCVASQWFRYASGRFEGAGDACSLTPLRQAFGASGGNLQELLVALTQTESFLTRRALTPQELAP
jgi:Protein of unknown function (DUF1592)/Protein of unknown function (DUF1588)/Protein of unknown function (DUF1587)/Protein of unknown function (DUF1595)/Protein of unknown function (DUF1585)